MSLIFVNSNQFKRKESDNVDQPSTSASEQHNKKIKLEQKSNKTQVIYNPIDIGRKLTIKANQADMFVFIVILKNAQQVLQLVKIIK